MRLGRFFDLAIAAGKRRDIRKNGGTYADSAILYGERSREIHRVLVGIDIDTQELLLAGRLKGQGIDCVLSHHPSGRAYASLADVLSMQVDILENAGLDRASAAGLIEERATAMRRKLAPQNHMRVPDAAKLLDMPLCCVHTPADNCCAWYITRLLRAKRPRAVRDIVDILLGEPEYRLSREECSGGPRIEAGDPGNPAGTIFVEMTGGSSSPKGAYTLLAKEGIRTVVSMSLGEDHLEKIREAGLNAVVAGHIPSDTLGLNLILDGIDKTGRLEYLSCSGFRRIPRP